MEKSSQISWFFSYAVVILTMAVLYLGTEQMSSMLKKDEMRTTFLPHPEEHVCEEIYVVRDGETLHTISDKCGDPFIVEENPHIHDPDDVFPGLVIKITPFSSRLHR